MLITHNAEVSPTFKNLIEFRATNYGRSPARILRAEMHASYPEVDQQPNFIDYLEKHLIYEHQEWVPVGKDVFVGQFSVNSTLTTGNPPIWKDVVNGKKKVWLHGIVIYADGLSDDTHITKFCYHCLHGESGAISGLIMDGPTGANKCT